MGFRVVMHNVQGDVNNDGYINVLDILIIVNMILSEQQIENSADLNQDGFINILDVLELINIILNN